MNSGCKSSVSCIDARRPVRPTYVNLYKWPESDAEFVKSMTGTSGGGGGDHNLIISSTNLDGRRKWSPSPRVVDSYSCRQVYLRSYVFSKEETATGKARQYLGKAKQRAAVLFPFLQQKIESRSSVTTRNSRRKEKKKGCGTDMKLREISYSALYSFFYRLLFCTASVEVADKR